MPRREEAQMARVSGSESVKSLVVQVLGGLDDWRLSARYLVDSGFMVPEVGIEPTRACGPLDFECINVSTQVNTVKPYAFGFSCHFQSSRLQVNPVKQAETLGLLGVPVNQTLDKGSSCDIREPGYNGGTLNRISEDRSRKGRTLSGGRRPFVLSKGLQLG